MVGLVLTTMPKSFHVKIDVTANDCEEYSFKLWSMVGRWSLKGLKIQTVNEESPVPSNCFPWLLTVQDQLFVLSNMLP